MQQALTLGEGRDGGEVGERESRVGRGLGEDELGVRLDVRLVRGRARVRLRLRLRLRVRVGVGVRVRRSSAPELLLCLM